MSKRSDKTQLTNAVIKKCLQYYLGDSLYCEGCRTTEPPLNIAHSYKKSQEHFPLENDHPEDWRWFECGCLCQNKCHREQEGHPERLQAIITPRTGESMRALAIEQGWYKV